MNKKYPKDTPANVIVFYVNVGNLADDETRGYVEAMKKTLDINWLGTETIFIPVREGETRVEVMHLQPKHEHY